MTSRTCYRAAATVAIIDITLAALGPALGIARPFTLAMFTVSLFLAWILIRHGRKVV